MTVCRVSGFLAVGFARVFNLMAAR